MALDETGFSVKFPKFVPVEKEDKLLEHVAIHAKDFAKI